MKNLEFDTRAFEDLAWWVNQDRRKALKIIELIQEIQRNPLTGTGQPEPLRRFAGLLVAPHRSGASSGV